MSSANAANRLRSDLATERNRVGLDVYVKLPDSKELLINSRDRSPFGHNPVAAPLPPAI